MCVVVRENDPRAAGGGGPYALAGRQFGPGGDAPFVPGADRDEIRAGRGIVEIQQADRFSFWQIHGASHSRSTEML